MGPEKRLVLDANILIRAIFGFRVRELLALYGYAVEFYTPDHCIEEARRNLPRIAGIRRIPTIEAEAILDQLLQGFLHVTDRPLYEQYEKQARELIADRDADDWPVIATAILLQAPIWTEDRDFSGCGIATWSTAKVEIFLRTR